MFEFLKKINFGTLIIATLTFILGWQMGHRDLNLAWENYHPKIKITNAAPPQVKDIDFKLFWQTWDVLSKEYVDKKALDPQKMYYGAISGMVSALGDPYTVFLPPEAQKSSKEELGGSFEGVGIQLGFNKEKRLVVIAPLDGTPAEKAGIKAGDIILKIADKDTSTITLPEAVNLIRGPRNTKITLQIYHDGDKDSKDVTLTRDTILVKSVEFEEKKTPGGKSVGIIKLSRFGEKTKLEWEAAVNEALAKNPAALILDLRNNPGGFLDGSIYISSEFIGSGDVVLQEGADGNKINYSVNRGGRLTKVPLLVLVNKGSASASEIVAGAIQDYKRGRLIGEQTFGKGTIQESEDLPEDTGLHVTTAKWLTPKERWIHNIGLTPDVVVEQGDGEVDNQLNEALKLLDQ